eukprot:Pgem_evm1s18318
MFSKFALSLALVVGASAQPLSKGNGLWCISVFDYIEVGPGCYHDDYDIYAPEESGYVSEESGYVSEESGYVSEESGYVSEESGYVSEEFGYASEESGYAPEESGYPSEEPTGWCIEIFGEKVYCSESSAEL